MYQSINKFLPLLLYLVLTNKIESRLVSPFGNYVKELTYPNKRIILSSSSDVVTDNDSFVYAICDNQETTFKNNKCNVTVETPAFTDASYRDTCTIDLSPGDIKRETLTKLSIYPFTDDKVLITWTVKDVDWNTKSLQIRIIYMTNCKNYDVTLLSDKQYAIIPYDNTFDVVVRAFDNKFCGSDYCKLTYSADGKKVNGPSQFLPGMKLANVVSVTAATPRSPMRGFYTLAAIGNKTDNLRVLQAAIDGKGSSELMKTSGTSNVKMSNAHDLLGVCWTNESTNVTCRQYDAKMSVKFTTVYKFVDKQPTKRWIRPHNLQDGGLLLLTGTSSGDDNRRFESFSLIKINPNGQKERPLVIDDLDFECLSATELHVNVAEEDNDEFCIHFVCERSDFDRVKGNWNTLKFSIKCLPRRHISILKHRPSLLN